MNNNLFNTPYGDYCLERLPIQKNQPLRAWDAADELIVSHLYESDQLKPSHKILIINDGFGALSVVLNAFSPYNWSDSYLAQQACLYNFEHNNLSLSVEMIDSTQAPVTMFDWVIIKIPRTLALLEDQLIRLKPYIHANTRIVAAAMVKYLPKSVFQLFEHILGVTSASLAKKKARLLLIDYSNQGEPLTSPYPQCQLEAVTQLFLCNHANVFSRDKLDIGTRFFLEQFKQLPTKPSIVDLGCGDGVLGIVAQQQQPSAVLTFVDESYMAIASAQANYQHAFADQLATFKVGNCLEHLNKKVDLVLCNPPFHQQQSVGDFIAWQMLTESHQQLNLGGEIWVVGNRHLNYFSKLKKIFGHCQLVASNRKFVVLKAVKR